MNPQPLIIERTFDVPIAVVWEAITELDSMKDWYFDMDAFEPEVGFEFSFEGCGEEGEKFVHICKVLEVVPGSKISHTWCYEGQPGESVVTIELFEEGSDTRLMLTHAGLETFDSTKPNFARDSFEAGWNAIIGKSLYNYLKL